jgi:hypothetical protein
MTNKLVEEAPYHPGYEDVGFKPPAKTLTDEEIIEVWGNIEETFNEEYDAKVFARAILRKAQEK